MDIESLATIIKSHIKQHTRRTKSGGVTVVHEHEDKRTKQADVPTNLTSSPP